VSSQVAAPGAPAAPVAPAAAQWAVEDAAFWEASGRSIARRNLAVSMPALLCGFAIWGFWSVITVWMKNLQWFGPDPRDPRYYELAAVAGLSGATLRIPCSFLVAVAGGRNVAAVTTALLLLPAVGVGVALQDPTTPYPVLVALALASGIGGGAFASSMSNISGYFPKRMQGLALGLNAGVGNLGVSVMQFALPLAITIPMFGALGGPARALPAAVPGHPAGTQVWIQNCGWVWVLPLAALAGCAWCFMTNLPAHREAATATGMARATWMHAVGLMAAGVGAYLYAGLHVTIGVVLPLTIVLGVLGTRFLGPSTLRRRVAEQYGIFRRKHTWVMSLLYVMTFGSFIGYSFVFGLLIKDVFGKLPDGAPNPDAPSPFLAFFGPLVGSLIRPVGGWLSDRHGGARVTQWSTVVMVASAIGAGLCLTGVGGMAHPEARFPLTFAFFLLLFVTAGIGNGSTFRMIPMIFDSKNAGPVLAWTSAVAAYGALLIPDVLKPQVAKGTPEVALYGFAGFYLVCLVVNWWFYARRGAEVRC
jgi:NNP family nitrate/nitrite transporter-like MFS transporter